MNAQRVKGLELAGFLVRAVGIAAFLAATFGCAGATPPQRAALDPHGELQPAATLGPGDQLDIKFLYTPNLDVTQTIRRDGKIAMPLIGEVTAAGLTPTELTERLKGLYSKVVLEPEITVLLRQQWARRVYVGGQVYRPRALGMPDRLTVFEAIMEAGGPDINYAELRNVLVIRSEDGRRVVGSVDLTRSFGLGDPDSDEPIEPFYLRPGDVVYVPETRIVEVNRWLDQHIHDPLLGAGARVTTGNTQWLYDLSGYRSGRLGRE